MTEIERNLTILSEGLREKSKCRFGRLYTVTVRPLKLYTFQLPHEREREITAVVRIA
jgi:hypothetical protein